MNSFDPVVERLTERLKGDPELRAEVSNELRGHLEDSAKEFMAGGRGEEEAWGEAVKAMGDEREVAEGLWVGNRKRMSRRRVGRWVVGGGLLSAAGVGTVVVAWGAVVSIAVALATVAMLMPKGATSYFGDRVFQKITEAVRAGRVEGMTPAARAVFEAGEGAAAERIEKSGALVGQARDPGERTLFAAHYAVQTLLDNGASGGRVADRAKFDRAIAALEAGKRAEPGNGIYALAEAGLLLGVSAEDVQPGEGQGPPWVFGLTDAQGKPETQEFYDYRVTDPELYARGIEQLREAARAKYVDSHVTDFASRRLAAMGPGTRLGDEYLKAREDSAVAIPYLNPARQAVNAAGAHALRLAQQGKAAEALDLVAVNRRVSRMMVESADGPMIELLVGMGMYDAALRQEAMAYRLAGDQGKFVEGRGRVQDLGAAVRRATVRGPAAAREYTYLKARAGTLDGMFLWSGTRPAAAVAGLTPGRRAEYAVADEVGVSALAAVLVMVGLWPAAGAVWQRWATGRWPVGVFVGWRRLGKVVWWAVVVPVGVYAANVAVPGVGGRDMGLSVGWDRLLVEYAAVGCAVVVLLRVIGGRAIAARAVELGMAVERERVGWVKKVMGGVLAVAVVAYLVVWRMTAQQAAWDGTGATGVVGVLLAAMLVAYAMAWSAGARREGTRYWRTELPGWVAPLAAVGIGVVLSAILYGNYGYRTGQAIVGTSSWILAMILVAVLIVGVTRGVRRRSQRPAGGTFGYGVTMAPLALAAVVVLVVAGGGVARWTERRAVAQMEALNGGGSRLTGEVARSNWAAARDLILSSPG